MKTRTELVMQAIGWQGGTVHDLCKYLGLDVNVFLTHKPENTFTGQDYNMGLYINTCTKAFINEKIVPAQQGNYDYWIGAARSMEIENNR